MATSRPEKLYGLLGYPLVHSFSQTYFNQKFESENISAKYVNFEIPDIGKLMEVVAENENLNGLNVTIPYKEQVIPFLDEIDAAASEVGAVNVIKFIRGKDGLKLKGYNSDIIGFTDSIKSLLKPYHTSALVLGTGGAAKAVSYSLRKLGLEVQLVSRRKSANTLVYEELTKNDLKTNKVIVNTTPLGMYPKVDTCPDIPYRYLTSQHLCYDLIYNPDETLFMKNSRQAGAQVKNGLEMLLLQAFASYSIWNQ
ncbi:MAG: shikimate dehydrogenase family protein [Muribaculaceae bacterium]